MEKFKAEIDFDFTHSSHPKTEVYLASEVDALLTDVAKLVEAAKKLVDECEAEFTLDGYWNNDSALVTRRTVNKSKQAIAAVEQHFEGRENVISAAKEKLS